jgi:preprotein translocase subunit SecA
LKYDDVLNRQRLVVYAERRRVLEGEDIEEQVRSFISDTVDSYVRGATAAGYPQDWDLEQLWTALKQLYPIDLSVAEIIEAGGGDTGGLTTDFLARELVDDAQASYDDREESLGEEVTRELERRVILSVLDRKWREHLYEMDYLRDGIGLRAMAQKDPLIEYQREGFDLFNAMMDGIKEETVGYLFNVQVEVQESGEGIVEVTADGLEVVTPSQPEVVAPGLTPTRPSHLEYSAPSEDGGVERESVDVPAEIDPNASRAERRRIERENRKLD